MVGTSKRGGGVRVGSDCVGWIRGFGFVQIQASRWGISHAGWLHNGVSCGALISIGLWDGVDGFFSFFFLVSVSVSALLFSLSLASVFFVCFFFTFYSLFCLVLSFFSPPFSVSRGGLFVQLTTCNTILMCV